MGLSMLRPGRLPSAGISLRDGGGGGARGGAGVTTVPPPTRPVRRAQSPFSTIATTDSYSSSIDEAELTTFDAATSDVTGFLVDLDGTVYRPGSLLPGSRAFLAWLRRTGKQYAPLHRAH